MTITANRRQTRVSRTNPIVSRTGKPANTSKKEQDRKRRPRKEENIIRGKEVTVRDAASPGQVIYGRTKVGGIVTFVSTDQGSKAYLVTGAEGDNNMLVWTAVTPGESGNDISIEMELDGTYGTTEVVSVTGSAIKIRLKSNSGVSDARLNNVISAIAASSPANALVTVAKSFNGTNGFVGDLSPTPLSYGGGQWLHQIITIACHEIDAVEKLYLDGQEITFGATPDPRWATGIWSNKVFMAVNSGADDQVAQPDLRGQLPTLWRETDRQQGCAHVYLILSYDSKIFPEGYPEIEFLVRGKKVFDSRTSTTVWSQNGALILHDFLKNSKFGLGSDLTCPGLSAAADKCDETITIVGGTEARYRIAGSFDTTDGPEKIIEEMEQAICGACYEQDGVLVIKPGQYFSPTITFDENDLRGPVSMNTHYSRSERFNAARGTFVDPTQDYNETDVPPVVNSLYETEDGKKIWQDFVLNFVQSPAQAQRILKIELEKIRQGISLMLPLKLSGLLAVTGDVVNLSLDEFGFTTKPFEVIDAEIVTENDTVIGVDLYVQETASGVFDWNNGEQTTYDLADNTDLPSATDVPEPTNVILSSGTTELYLRNDGAVFSRLKVSWESELPEFVESNGGYEIQYKRTAEGNWQQVPLLPGGVTFYHILDVEDRVAYDVRIRAFNILGVVSDWVQPGAHTVVGKTEPPSNVSQFGAFVTSYGMGFNWIAIPDLDADEYEIRVGESWEDSVFVWRGRGITARWESKVAASYLFWIKAYDTSGNQSLQATQSNLDIVAPGAPTITYKFDGPNVLFEWTTPPDGSFKIADYIISFGPSYPTSTQIQAISGNNYLHRADWGGVRTFWIAARDIANNLGPAGLVTINIFSPNPVKAFGVTTINQNVLLNWLPPDASTLPIAYYKVWKGDTYEGSLLLGDKYGSFHTYLEQFGGVFFYHVEAVDTAGNIGAHMTAQGRVEEPDNFYIKADNNLLIQEAATLTNAVEVPRQPEKFQNDIFLPVDTTVPEAMLPDIILGPNEVSGTETFQAWWDNNGWENLQQAVDQEYDLPFLAPTSTRPGSIKWVVDYEVTFNSSFISFQFAAENLGDVVEFIPSIAISSDGITYTEYTGAQQVFAENFRYVEYRLDFQGRSDKAFAKVTLARALISLKRETEFIVTQAQAADHGAGGTPFTFTKNFLDVEDIQATVWGTAAALGIPIINFQDDPNPTGARVLLFDIEGDPLSGQVRIQVTGAIQS